MEADELNRYVNELKRIANALEHICTKLGMVEDAIDRVSRKVEEL